MLISCHCQQCNRAIEFDPEVQAIGTMINCPQCSGLTALYMPANRLRGDLKRRGQGDSQVRMAYAATILLPFVGFFFGIYLMTQRKHEHGLLNIALSIVLSVIYATILANLL